MKKYNQFINEKLTKVEKANNNLRRTYIVRHDSELNKWFEHNGLFDFSIDLKNKTDDKLKNAITNFEKHINKIDDTNINELLSNDCQMWNIEMWKIRYTDTIYEIALKIEPCYFISFIYDDITLDEFLDVGLEGVNELFEMKDNIKNFNL